MVDSPGGSDDAGSVDGGFWDKASMQLIDAKQRNRKSAPPKPHGHRLHRTTTAALHIADHDCVTWRVALKTARLSAFGVQPGSTCKA